MGASPQGKSRLRLRSRRDLDLNLLTSKSRQFICVVKRTEVVNLVKFLQAVCKISCSQSSSIWSRTYGHPENRMRSAAARRRRHNNVITSRQFAKCCIVWCKGDTVESLLQMSVWRRSAYHVGDGNIAWRRRGCSSKFFYGSSCANCYDFFIFCFTTPATCLQHSNAIPRSAMPYNTIQEALLSQREQRVGRA